MRSNYLNFKKKGPTVKGYFKTITKLQELTLYLD